jgi:hypothetical protein
VYGLIIKVERREKYKKERERERLAIAQRDRLVIRHRLFPSLSCFF